MTHTDIHLLLTGDELMSGDTVDSNSSMIAQSLSAYGHSVAEKVTLGDNRTRLIRALERAAGVARIPIMNGGLGPTQDDPTAELWPQRRGPNSCCTPKPTGTCANGGARGIEPNEANLKQAWLPAGVSIANPEVAPWALRLKPAAPSF